MNLRSMNSRFSGLPMLVIAAALAAVGAQAQVTTNLWEDFSLIATNVSASTDIGTTMDTYTHVPGWTGTKVYNGTNALKLGSSSVNGSLYTPALDLSGNGGGATLKFRARWWSAADATVMRVLMDGAAQGADITPTTDWTTYEVALAGGAAASKVQFTSIGSAGDRFFLDDIVIYQDSGLSDPPQIVIAAPPAMVANDVSSLTLNGTANTNVAGDISWTNDAALALGTIPAATNWSIPSIPLSVGTNLLVVAGTNLTGVAVIRTATVVRVTADYLGTVVLGPPTGIDATRFTANWTGALNAAGYYLDAALDPSFSTNTSAVIVRERFESGFNGWSTTSLFGSAQSWTVTNILGLGGTGCARMNGYSTTDSNEDWLLSPAIDLSASVQPVFSFMSALHYAGPEVQVLISTNYTPDVPVDELTVTWYALPAVFGPTGYVWTSSGEMDLADYRASANVHIAFRYTSSAGSGNALAFLLDDVQIRDRAFVGADDFVPGCHDRDVGLVTSAAVTGLVEGATYYYRVRPYNAAATGAYSSVGSVLTIAADLPAVAIATPPTNVLYATSTFAIEGTANVHTTGWIAWTNSAGGGGAVAAATNWTISPIPLAVGTNRITVVGTNDNARASTASVAVVRFPNNVVLAEGFDGGTNAPAGWTFANVTATYTGAGYYGAAPPAIQLNSNTVVTTKLFARATNLAFWARSTGTTPEGRLIVLQYDGATWTELLVVTNPAAAGTEYSVALATNVVQVQFSWEKVVGNIALDDVLLTGYESGGPAPAAEIGVVSLQRGTGTLWTVAWTGATANCTVSMSTNLAEGFAPLMTDIPTNSATFDAGTAGPRWFLRVEQPSP